jgi:hypothetical protein
MTGSQPDDDRQDGQTTAAATPASSEQPASASPATPNKAFLASCLWLVDALRRPTEYRHKTGRTVKKRPPIIQRQAADTIEQLMRIIREQAT